MTEPPPTEQRRFRRRLDTTLLRAGLVVVGIAALIVGYRVLLIAFAAIILAILLEALVDLIRRLLPIGRGAGYGILAGLFTLCMAAGGLLFYTGITQEYDELSDKLQSASASASSWTKNIMQQLQQNWNGGGQQSGMTWEQLLQQASSFIPESMSAAWGVIGALTMIGLIIVLAAFMLAEPELYRRGIVKMAPPRHRERTDQVLRTLYHNMRSWLLGKSLAMVFVTISTIVGLLFLGIPGAFLLGIFSGILTFVPNFGPIISSIPPILIGLTQGGLDLGASVAALYVGVQLVEGNLVTPLIQRRVARVAPAILLLSQVTAAVFMGVLGLILAVPLALTAQVLTQELYIRRAEKQAIDPTDAVDPESQIPIA